MNRYGIRPLVLGLGGSKPGIRSKDSEQLTYFSILFASQPSPGMDGHLKLSRHKKSPHLDHQLKPHTQLGYLTIESPTKLSTFMKAKFSYLMAMAIYILSYCIRKCSSVIASFVMLFEMVLTGLMPRVLRTADSSLQIQRPKVPMKGTNE